MDGRVLTTLPKHGQSTRQPGAELPLGPTSQWELFEAHLNGTGGIQTGPSVGMQGTDGLPYLGDLQHLASQVLKIVVEAPEIQNQAESPVLHPAWEPKDSVRKAQLGGPQHPPPILHISPGELSVMGLGLVTQGS